MKERISRSTPPRGLRLRLAAAGFLTLATAALILAFGRSAAEPTAAVAVTSEQWEEGAAAGYTTLQVPQELAPFFVSPGQLDGRVAATDLQAGVFLSDSLLRADDPGGWEEPAPEPPGTTRVRLNMDIGLWPPPGPQAGAAAVVADAWGGCGLAVLELLEVEPGGMMTVRVTPELAAALAAAPRLLTWPPASDGWPLCGAGGA